MKEDQCTDAPDVVFGFDISAACLHHDLKYEKGGTEQDRKFADEELRKEIIEKTHNKIIAWIYYLAVRWFGRRHFNYD